MNSFGILNQMKRPAKCGDFSLIVSHLQPKKKHDIRKMGSNQTEIAQKKNDHKHFKRVGRKARETIAQNPLKAHSSFL